MITIASLKKGQRGIIKEFSVDVVPLKLLEMGCLPGNEVTLVQIAPFKIHCISTLTEAILLFAEKQPVRLKLN